MRFPFRDSDSRPDTGASNAKVTEHSHSRPDRPVDVYSWTENGTEIANGSMPTATFAVGVHTVTLTVTDDQGGTDTDEVIITVEAAPQPVSFAAEILPYFAGAPLANCVQCHSGGTGSGGVNLDSYANILAGGDNGPLVVAGEPDNANALLVPQLEANHFDGPDDAGFVNTLKQWISEGALDN